MTKSTAWSPMQEESFPLSFFFFFYYYFFKITLHYVFSTFKTRPWWGCRQATICHCLMLSFLIWSSHEQCLRFVSPSFSDCKGVPHRYESNDSTDATTVNDEALWATSSQHSHFPFCFNLCPVQHLHRNCRGITVLIWIGLYPLDFSV